MAKFLGFTLCVEGGTHSGSELSLGMSILDYSKNYPKTKEFKILSMQGMNYAETVEDAK